jgi:predicted nuclease with TOPRIM domain
MNFDTVYICLDNDPAGIKGFLKFRDCIRGTGTDVRRIILPKNRDINKIGKVEIFRRLFDRAKPVL